MLFAKKGESEFDKRPIGVIIEAIICLFIVGFLSFLAINNINIYKDSKNANKKRCFSNLRMINEAVEMYNMDVSEMMVNIDLKTLINNKYLKEEAIDGLKCKFKNTGDLSQDGFVYCEYHGDLSGNIKGTDLTVKVISKEDQQKQFKEKIISGLIIALLILIIPAFRIIIAMCIPMKK